MDLQYSPGSQSDAFQSRQSDVSLSLIFFELFNELEQYTSVVGRGFAPSETIDSYHMRQAAIVCRLDNYSRIYVDHVSNIACLLYTSRCV